MKTDQKNQLETTKLWQATKRTAKSLAAQDGITMVEFINALVMKEKDRRELEDTHADDPIWQQADAAYERLTGKTTRAAPQTGDGEGGA